MINNDHNNNICSAFEAFSKKDGAYLSVKFQDNKYSVLLTDKKNSSSLLAITDLVKLLLVNPSQLTLEQTHGIKSGLTRIVAKIQDKKMSWITFIFGGFVHYYVCQYTLEKARSQIDKLGVLALEKRVDQAEDREKKIREDLLEATKKQQALNQELLVEKTVNRLEISNIIITSPHPFNNPNQFYWMITQIGPFRPLWTIQNVGIEGKPRCGNALQESSQNWVIPNWPLPLQVEEGIPENEKLKKICEAIQPIVEECKQNCLERGNKQKGQTLYNPQAIFDLCLINKNKIISAIGKLEQVAPKLENIREFVDLKKVLEADNINQEACVETFVTCLTSPHYMDYCFNPKHGNEFFRSLRDAACGKLYERMLQDLDLPEKGLKELWDIQTAFPVHTHSTIRNLFHYFEASPYRKQCVETILKKLEPFTDGGMKAVYIIVDHKLSEQGSSDEEKLIYITYPEISTQLADLGDPIEDLVND